MKMNYHRMISAVAGFLILASIGCAAEDEKPVAIDVPEQDAGELLSDVDAADAADAADPGADVVVLDPDGVRTLGGDRPAKVVLPANYDVSQKWPLVVLLHGYSANAALQEIYFRLGRQVNNYGFIMLLPNGTKDRDGSQFWNATPACCDFLNTGVDDVGYLRGLVDEAEARLSIDTERIYFMGHSNGGFMSFRMACEMGERIAAIASLAGGVHQNDEDCVGDTPVGVLHIHGDNDDVVRYGGGILLTAGHPGARAAAERWAVRNGCENGPIITASRDFETSLPGEETKIEYWSACEQRTSVQLWTLQGGSHIPSMNDDFTPALLDFLFSHSKATP